MHALGVSLMALGSFGLLLFASHIAWEAARDLRYVSRLDDWGQDVPPWQ